jgi:hypothetical protein
MALIVIDETSCSTIFFPIGVQYARLAAAQTPPASAIRRSIPNTAL